MKEVIKMQLLPWPFVLEYHFVSVVVQHYEQIHSDQNQQNHTLKSKIIHKFLTIEANEKQKISQYLKNE